MAKSDYQPVYSFSLAVGWAIPRKTLHKKSLIGKGEFGGKAILISELHGSSHVVAN